MTNRLIGELNAERAEICAFCLNTWPCTPDEHAAAIWNDPDDLYHAIGEDAFARLTRTDKSLERDLHGVLVRVYQVGYRAGLRAGGQLVADAVADRIGPASVVVNP